MQKNTFLVCKTLAFLLIFSLKSLAQPRFSGGVVAGITASQIDGDLSAGYNKLGFQAGLRVGARLKTRTEATMDFLFSQRGCQDELRPNQFSRFSVTLNYVEVPVLIHYKDWLVDGDGDEDYYRVSACAGLSYARFISSSFQDEFSFLRSVVPDYLNKNDLSFVLGFNFMANRHVGFSFRYNRSITFMYNPKNWNPAPVSRGWLGHCLYFQGFYVF